MTHLRTSTPTAWPPEETTSAFWEDLDRERRELAGAWIATVPSTLRAQARRAYRLSPPCPAALTETASLLAVAAPATRPATWLKGSAEYVGVVARHPTVPGSFIVASGGVFAVGTERSLKVGQETADFFIDQACSVERALLSLLEELPEQCQRLSDIRAASAA